MLSQGEWERLLAAVVLVYTGKKGEGADGGNAGRLINAGCSEFLSQEQRDLVAALNGALARIVEAAKGRSELAAPPENARIGALGGAEMVTRAEILSGRADALPDLLPAFAYLATLPYLSAEEARRLCTEAERVVSEGSWRDR